MRRALLILNLLLIRMVTPPPSVSEYELDFEWESDEEI